MNENIKISVIVPVYNAMNYLDRSVQSVLSQTYTNYELLLINDGSKDSSGAICDKYAEQDKRVRVFHQENGGVSSARNKGLKYINGDWVFFLDSDDYIDNDAFESLIDCIVRYPKVDLIRSYHRLLTIDGKLVSEQPNVTERYFTRDAFMEYGKIGGYISSLFVKNEIIKQNNLLFSTELKMREDLYFTFQCVVNAQFILQNSRVFYNCLRHDEQTTFTMDYDKVLNILDSSILVYRYALGYDNVVVKRTVSDYLVKGISGYVSALSRLDNTKNIKIKSVRNSLLKFIKVTDFKLNKELDAPMKALVCLLLIDYHLVNYPLRLLKFIRIKVLKK